MEKNKTNGKKSTSINPPPPALSLRICACGCGTEFQPRRSDQKFVTGTHADFAYNQTIRKAKNSAFRQIDKILKRNDRILSKYYKTGKDEEANCFLIHLKAEGFDSSFYTGSVGAVPNQSFLMYYYRFTLYESNGHQLIKIQKR